MSSPYEFEKNAREIKEDCKSTDDCFNCPYFNGHVKVVETNGEVSHGRCMWACIGMDEPWRWNFDYDREDLSMLTGSEWRPYKRLAVAIVTAYVNDWIDANIMCESRGVLPERLDKYRWQRDKAEAFFKGKLCASCEAATGLSGDYILNQLRKGNATKIVHTLEVKDE